MREEDRGHEIGRHVRPLRIAVLMKQVPVTEAFSLGADGRLQREGVAQEINPFCRRAIAKGAELARATGGTCTVLTLGPPSAEDALREAIAWGADLGVHLCDPMFAGSDTLATARALAAGLRRHGPFDLILAGRNSIDGETAQVAPELAQLLDLPFASAARRLTLVGAALDLGLEHDDGSEEVLVELPAIVTVAERLCEPAKADAEARGAVPADRITRLSAGDLGDGPWGSAGSPTVVGAVRVLRHERATKVLSGDIASQVATAVELLSARGALQGTPRGAFSEPGVACAHSEEGGTEEGGTEEEVAAAEVLATPSVGDVARGAPRRGDQGGSRAVLVVLEPGRPQFGVELLGAAVRLGEVVGGAVVALVPPDIFGPHDRVHLDAAVAPGVAPSDTADVVAASLGLLGADVVLRVTDAAAQSTHSLTPSSQWAAEDVAEALISWVSRHAPWAVLAPSTAFGREVAARTAAALGAGLVGDAIEVDVVNGRMVAAKPAFAGALVADITCSSLVQLVTIRPGVLRGRARGTPRACASHVVALPARRRSRVLLRAVERNDDVELLGRADVVIGLGTGVAPQDYPEVQALSAALGAELAVTRRVADRGWAPRGRQVGLTGRSIAPRLYIAIGLSGKFNHMVGVQGAGTVLAINEDPDAPVFAHADVGIVGDWHDAVPLLATALRDQSQGLSAPRASGSPAPRRQRASPPSSRA